MFFRWLPIRILCLTLALSASLQGRAEGQGHTPVIPDSSLRSARTFWVPYTASQRDEVWEELKRAHWLQEGPHPIEKGLAAISLTAAGRDLLREVYPLVATKKLTIASIQSPEGLRLAGRVDAGGLYYASAIYIDDQAPLLAFAATLYHELVHARDYLLTADGIKRADLLGAYNSMVTDLQRQRSDDREITAEQMGSYRAAKKTVTPILLASEHRAYRAQNAFLGEFISLDGAFEMLIQELTDREYWVAYPVREFDFQHMMTHRNGANLPPSEVEAYLKANPFNGSRPN